MSQVTTKFHRCHLVHLFVFFFFLTFRPLQSYSDVDHLLLVASLTATKTIDRTDAFLYSYSDSAGDCVVGHNGNDGVLIVVLKQWPRDGRERKPIAGTRAGQDVRLDLTS